MTNKIDENELSERLEQLSIELMQIINDVRCEEVRIERFRQHMEARLKWLAMKARTAGPGPGIV